MNVKSIIFSCIFSGLLIISTTTPAEIKAPVIKKQQNVWDALTNEFSLNHEVQNPEVQKHLKWILKHPEYINKLAIQSKPYIYHVLNELRKRNMPGEIALIPMIESEYDPFSSSGAGAAGLWQLMPETSSEFALQRDWWVDGRRSITPSTDTALNYLDYLHHFFHGNWILAFAAYDSGEGRVSRAIKDSHQQRFWTLPLPQETKNYVPKLLALSEIIQNPKRYHVQLPHIPHEPYFTEINLKSRLDLKNAAKLAKMPSHDFLRLNPEFKQWPTQPYRPYKLLIPTEHLDDFNRNLANLPNVDGKSKSSTIPQLTSTSAAKPPSLNGHLNRYRVKQGDSLSRIARHHHLTLKTLRQLNPGVTDRHLKPNQWVIIQR